MENVFAGKQRHGDLQEHLRRLGRRRGITITYEPIDIERGEDLREDKIWDRIFRQLRAFEWDVLIASPPK